MLLDSVILIDHLNGIPAATQFIAENSAKLVLSHITVAEVLAGLPEARHAPILRLFARFPCLSITLEIAIRASVLRLTFNVLSQQRIPESPGCRRLSFNPDPPSVEGFLWGVDSESSPGPSQAKRRQHEQQRCPNATASARAA